MRFTGSWWMLGCLVCSCLHVHGQQTNCIPYLKPSFLSDSSRDKRDAAQYKKVIPTGSTLRFILPVLDETTLIVYEPPNAEHDILEPDTRLALLRGGNVTRKMSFREIGVSKEFRVVSAARLCAGDSAVIYLASGAGATGASEFFVALVIDAAGLRAFKLPMANQGSLELFESNPFKVRMWSAADEDMGNCGACRKHYDVSEFTLETDTGFTKTSQRRTPEMMRPAPLIERPLVLLRPSEPQR